MDEPRYVPLGQEFEEQENWQTTDDLVNQDVLSKCFVVTRRSKAFKNQSERTSWVRIDQRISNGKIPLEWVENCIEWALKKNGPLYPRVAIRFPALTNLILNKAAMQDFMLNNPTLANKVVEEQTKDQENWSDDFE